MPSICLAVANLYFPPSFHFFLVLICMHLEVYVSYRAKKGMGRKRQMEAMHDTAATRTC
jgi:hypothetical protein